MKIVDIDNLDKLSGKNIKADDIFAFRCHSRLACFNRCCRNLNLFLYPYDVIRLKNRLKLSSDRFLDKYVDIVLRSYSFFPEVLLQMSDDKDKTCPFLTESGCSVYSDRPDACRTFPVEQGVFFDVKENKTSKLHFFRPQDFCLGRHESKTRTIRQWIEDQNAGLYNKMTILWSELKLSFQTDPWGNQGPDGPKGKMAFMATYNIDRFRDFVFKSSFLKRYKVESNLLKKNFWQRCYHYAY